MKKAIKTIVLGFLSVSLLFTLSACSQNSSNTTTQTADNPPVETPKVDKKAEFLEYLDGFFSALPTPSDEEAADFEWFKNDYTNRLLKRMVYNLPKEKQDQAIQEELYIMYARSIYLVKEPSIHFGDAFDYFFDKANWEYFEGTREGSDDLVQVVEFTGDFLYDNSPASALIQFEIDEDGNCDYSYYARNGNPETMTSLNYLVDDVIETYKLYMNKATPAN